MERLVSILAVATLSAVAGFGSPLLAHARPNACRTTSRFALLSCRAGAQSDKLVALGRCNNVADASTKRRCGQTAASDAKDAAAACNDEHDARQAACKRLGPTPYAPTVDPAKFATSTTIDNPLFPLVAGTTFVYEGDTADGHEHDEFFVTHNTRTILGVTCVEVHDTVTTNGQLTEDTLDWFAQDVDGNVWYFGENTKTLAGGLVVDLEGSWTAGVDGAQPGMIMEAHSKVGDFYRQEFLLGTAEDLAEVLALDESVTVESAPPHTYDHCLKTQETSPLEPDVTEFKFYAPHVGNVLTMDTTTGERSDLVAITTGG